MSRHRLGGILCARKISSAWNGLLLLSEHFDRYAFFEPWTLMLKKLNIPCIDLETWGCPKYERLKQTIVEPLSSFEPWTYLTRIKREYTLQNIKYTDSLINPVTERAYAQDHVETTLQRLYNQYKTNERTVVTYKGSHVEKDLLDKVNILVSI